MAKSHRQCIVGVFEALSGPLPSIDMARNPHQVSRLQQVRVSQVLGLERGRENKEEGVCTNGSGSKGVTSQ